MSGLVNKSDMTRIIKTAVSVLVGLRDHYKYQNPANTGLGIYSAKGSRSELDSTHKNGQNPK